MIIDIDNNLIPYRFDMQLQDMTFTFEVHYNSEYDFFTIDLYRGETYITTEKIVYGQSLFQNALHLDVPPILIVPYDLTEQEPRVTYENLGVSVFLYLLVGDADG